ncbi:MAG: S-adenosylmethionine:tRNA ribosyltransferase-isomerase [Prevotella sp.]|nr:S-adenosylmethionine:tRNA ribosyltransferase-isomerase [Prevotella sp.]MDD6738171.1 S-adenosylmethionine:tRNA ribosyltransferase-isomerase [Prevotella sp.]
MNTKDIQINDYNYPLSDERIAKYPLKERDHSKLLIYKQGKVSEDVFFHVADYLPMGSLMVMNNTKVIQARLHFRKATGALIEIFLLEPALPADYEQMFQSRGRCEWFCLVGNLKKWKEGQLSRGFTIDDHEVTVTAERVGEAATSQRIAFTWDDNQLSMAELIDSIGELPIPPYLNRKTEECDKTTYQTVYSKIKGSVAAPTAGLHFTADVLASLDNKGIEREEVTLHVGAGTFKPVKSLHIGEHDMHTETFCVKKQTIERLIAHQGHAVAVGTTSVRTLESLYYIGYKMLQLPNAEEQHWHVEQWEPYQMQVAPDDAPTTMEALQAIANYMQRNALTTLHGSTQIIIAPGYNYHIVKMLITNFHQPQSTLLLLVSAFVHGDWRNIYDYALQHEFRFLSYGDSSLLIP